MPEKKLVAVVTALMMSAAAFGARADVTFEQLETIDRLLTQNNTRALWAYLQEYPELLAGEDELSLELRKFCTDVTLGRLRCHYVPDGDSVQAARTAGGVAGVRASSSQPY
ncbi:hypothetical protein [Tropicimonas sediminicola]|uniref:Uncharacterized protein n=1 Tax=Tropicimonas sediminicola TaxID=1031541 RepID=A0A239K1H6_9RHOB|nr:hypothetical protein [Tropicimonas sediminicola]SNT12217.1 hypothetical protein SAMN05421757_106204 [Tropicimonas sediminicola]